MQTAGDAGPLERLFVAIFLPECHQAGHLGFGNCDFFSAPIGQGHIGNFIIGNESCHGTTKCNCIRINKGN